MSVLVVFSTNFILDWRVLIFFFREESLEAEVEPVKLENSSIEKIEKVDESPFGNHAIVELVDDIIEK